jgi:hypothetical protein
MMMRFVGLSLFEELLLELLHSGKLTLESKNYLIFLDNNKNILVFNLCKQTAASCYQTAV